MSRTVNVEVVTLRSSLDLNPSIYLQFGHHLNFYLAGLHAWIDHPQRALIWAGGLHSEAMQKVLDQDGQFIEKTKRQSFGPRGPGA